MSLIERLPNLWSVVANKRNYLARLHATIQHLHNCCAIHCDTVPVHEVFRGQTVWKGERFVTVLEIPSVESALTAVRASIVTDSKKTTQ